MSRVPRKTDKSNIRLILLHKFVDPIGMLVLNSNVGFRKPCHEVLHGFVHVTQADRIDRCYAHTPSHFRMKRVIGAYSSNQAFRPFISFSSNGQRVRFSTPSSVTIT